MRSSTMRADVAAFQYGLVSSSLSRLLNGYMTTGKVEPGSESLLKTGVELIDDIRAAQDAVGGKSSLQPNQAFDLAGYRCALQLIADHEEEFDVHNRGQLAILFSQIRETLSALSSEELKKPEKDDVSRSRVFFKRLAELMTTELSRSEPTKRQLLASR